MTPSKAEPRSNGKKARRTASTVITDLITLARESTTRQQFLASALRCIASNYVSPYAALHLRLASMEIQDDCHFGRTDPEFWKGALQGFLTDTLAESRPRARLLQDRSSALNVAFLGCPIRDENGTGIGAMALVVMPPDHTEVESILAAVDTCVELSSYLMNTVAAVEPEQANSTSSDSGKAAYKALSQAAAFTSHVELAFTISNDLCNKLGCEQVAVGLAERKRIRVLSVSGLDSVNHRSPGVVAIRSAMEECMDVGTPIVQQSGGAWDSDESTSGYRLHKQWHSSVQGDAVASIPLKIGDETAAVLSLRQRPDSPFTKELIEKIRASVEPCAAALHAAKRAGRGLPAHAIDSLRSGWHTVIGPEHWGAKFGTWLAFLGTLLFFFGSMDYELTVPCAVTPTHVRNIAAPYDSVIERAHVIQGDRVEKGQLLCLLDHRELSQQLSELNAEQLVASHERDRALADDNPVEAQLATARMSLLAAQIDIVEHRIEQASLRAPFDGVIVTGDLRRSIGSVVTQGDQLFSVAPLTEWTLELSIPDGVSNDFAAGQQGVFVSYARPDLTRSLTIDRIRPSAEVRDGVNVFVAEAAIPISDNWMRPGMEGIAQVELGRRRICYVALRRLLDYLYVNFWL